MSSLPLAICLPSGLKNTLNILLSCPPKFYVYFPSKRFQILIVLSLLPLAICLPSGLNITLVIIFSCPSNFYVYFPSKRFQILIVLSSLPLAICLPSGLNTTLVIIFSCPSKICYPKSTPPKLVLKKVQDSIFDRSKRALVRSHSEKVQLMNTLRFRITFGHLS